MVYNLYNGFIFIALSGAITKGDRRAATGADLTQFNFDTPYGRQSLKSMYGAIQKVIVVMHFINVCDATQYQIILRHF